MINDTGTKMKMNTLEWKKALTTFYVLATKNKVTPTAAPDKDFFQTDKVAM